METQAFNTYSHISYDMLTQNNELHSQNIRIFRNMDLGTRDFEDLSTIKTYGILLCLKGTASISANLKHYDLKRDTLMLFSPGTIISIFEKSPDLKIHLMFIPVDFTESEAFIDTQRAISIWRYFYDNHNATLSLNQEEVGLVHNFFDLMYNLATFNKSSIIHSTLSTFMCLLSEMIDNRMAQKQIGSTRQMDYFERFIKEVATHHKDHRNVSFYADALYITPKYLSTLIKDVSGRSASEWINDFVMQEAKKMLRYTNKSVQEITYSLNFATPSFFGKYFKRNVGMSPGEYRLKTIVI